VVCYSFSVRLFHSLLHVGLSRRYPGKPLTQLHGAPLRLHAPTKYGYKQIKRIGLIAYTDAKPDDYWTKLGYDWYAGL
jgi:DMSO/TMAO reductase YedYZ molybdopterin-dependent catalytic subunit